MKHFLLTLLAAAVCAAPLYADQSGSCGSDLSWTFNSETGELTISGSGVAPQESFSENDVPNTTDVKKIIFAEDCAVSKIESHFFDCYSPSYSQLTDIEIHSTVPLTIDYQDRKGPLLHLWRSGKCKADCLSCG